MKRREVVTVALFGAIDIGTNSVRLLLAEVEKDRVVKPKFTLLKSTRLGEGMYPEGFLMPAAIERTAEALREFRRVMEDFGEVPKRIVATSAAREAKNSSKLLDSVRETAGFQVEIIGGDEEATLSYWGAATSLSLLFPVVVDVGGGSTEVAAQVQADKLLFSSSQVGAVRCTEQKMGTPAILLKLQPDLEKFLLLGGRPLLATGGTATSLAAVAQRMDNYDPGKVHGYRLDRIEIEALLQLFTSLTLAELKFLPGLQTARADVIAAGTRILLVVMDFLGANYLTVSEGDLLYGIILQLSGAPVPGRSM